MAGSTCRLQWPPCVCCVQVSLEGGELALDAAGPFNPAYGRPLLRQQLLAALGGSSGPPGTPFGVAAQLSAGLQRLLALSQAVGELQQQPARPGGNGSGSNTAAAVQVLVQVGTPGCCSSTMDGSRRRATAGIQAAAGPEIVACELVVQGGRLVWGGAGREEVLAAGTDQDFMSWARQHACLYSAARVTL